MQDLTLIRDEDALPLQGPDGRLQPGPVGLLDTIEDLGTWHALGCGKEARAKKTRGFPWALIFLSFPEPRR